MITESRIRNIVRNSMAKVLNEGLWDTFKSGFSSDDEDDGIDVSQSDFDCDKVAYCMLDYDGMDTQPDYIGLGDGDYGDDDLAYIARDVDDFNRLRTPRNGTGFSVKSVIRIEEA